MVNYSKAFLKPFLLHLFSTHSSQKNVQIKSLICLYWLFQKYCVFWRIFSSLPPLPRQHWAPCNGRQKKAGLLKLTVHLYCVVSLAGCFQRVKLKRFLFLPVKIPLFCWKSFRFFSCYFSTFFPELERNNPKVWTESFPTKKTRNLLSFTLRWGRDRFHWIKVNTIFWTSGFFSGKKKQNLLSFTLRRGKDRFHWIQANTIFWNILYL